MRHARDPAERLLAAVPLVLAVHQLVEAFVWWGLQGKVPADVGRVAEWLYLAIAFGVLPVLVPLAVAALEPDTHPRRMRAFVVLGVFVAVVLMYAVLRGPYTATIEGHHIDYRVDLWHGGALVVLYVVATCGSLLASDAPPRARVGSGQPRRRPAPGLAEPLGLHLAVVRVGGDHERRHRLAPASRVARARVERLALRG